MGDYETSPENQANTPNADSKHSGACGRVWRAGYSISGAGRSEDYPIDLGFAHNNRSRSWAPCGVAWRKNFGG